MDYLNSYISSEILESIEKEVIFLNGKYSVQNEGQIKDDIFSLLDKVGTLILYPIEEENLLGIYISKNDKNYFILNSSLKLEYLVFAAAHELAHSLDIAKVNFEIVTSELMTEYVNHADHGEKLKEADIIANRFAAEFLVGTQQLLKQYKDVPKTFSTVSKAVKLSDIFLVPYKTIIKRLAEVKLIDDQETIDDLLAVDNKTIEEIADRLECRRRNNEVKQEKRLGNYVNKALTLYENELSTYDELSEHLKLLKKTPEELGIIDDNINIYDLLNQIEGNIDCEEDDE